jgi:hypothetical protein
MLKNKYTTPATPGSISSEKGVSRQERFKSDVVV